MVDLTGAAPWPELPDRLGDLRMRAVMPPAITQVLPLSGRDVSAALEEAVGVRFPGAGESHESGSARIVWSGRNEALVLGPPVAVEGALCVDQSDGWAALRLSGAVREVLTRLTPLDMRDASFRVGATARSLLGHVSVSLTRIDAESWLLLVPRSMAGSALDEISHAAQTVAARHAAEGD